jgi:poly-gamma-glutamate synthesis protein (capsule biosynthesis protein)
MTTISFGAVGDISLGDHPLCAGFGTHSQLRGRDAKEIFGHVAGALAASDFVFGNLECTLSELGKREGDYHSIQMRGQPGYIEGLKHSGFTALNVANNHSMQHGEENFEDTTAILEAHGITVCGLASKRTHRAELAETVVKGLRLGLLGYSLRPRQYFTQQPLYAEGVAEEMVEDVRRVAKQCDAVVVSVHWGDEFIDVPAPGEVVLARALVDAGAALIIGHHPHVLRGVERYRHGIIVYSLGNFVCDMLWDSSLRESAIFRCRLSKEGATDPTIVPVWINDTSQPTIASAGCADRILARLTDLSRQLESGPYTLDEAAYEKAAAAVHAAIRAKSHRYFLKNVYRYPYGLLFQNLANFTRNRVKEIRERSVKRSRAHC